MTAALQPQPAACAACGQPYAEPYCEHVKVALAALVTDPKPLRTVDDYFTDAEGLFVDSLLDEADGIVAQPERRSYSFADLRRGFCPTAAYYVVRRTS